MPDWPKDLTSSMISSLSLFSNASSTTPNENIYVHEHLLFNMVIYGNHEALMTWRK
jgi:hypothetical protein